MTIERRLLALHDGSFGIDSLTVSAIIDGTIAAGEAVLRGSIIKPDEPNNAGKIKRCYRPSPDYAAEVYNAGLAIPKHWQDRGFGSDLSAVVEDGYRSEQIRFVRLVAGRSVGGAVWAATFDYDEDRLPGFGKPTEGGSGVGEGGEDFVMPRDGDPITLRRTITQAIADAALTAQRVTSKERGSIEPLLPELINPGLIRALDKNKAIGSNLGSRILRGSRWPGVKDLLPNAGTP